MRYVLGMAKGYLDLKGSRAPTLQQNFLQLDRAVLNLRSEGSEAKGYLMVLTEAVAARARRWQERFHTLDRIEVLVAELTATERLRLDLEKVGQRAGRDPIATQARLIGEDHLRRAIHQREPGVVDAGGRHPPPDGVRWDFFGVRR